MMLAIAVELDYEMFMLDVQMVFLNADVEEHVSVKVLPGCEIARRVSGHRVQEKIVRSPAEPE